MNNDSGSLLRVVGALVYLSEARTCSVNYGPCTNDCAARCTREHPGGNGYCFGDIPSAKACNCDFSCPGPPAPPAPPRRNCSGTLGLCSSRCEAACCNGNCAAKFNNGIGFCNTLGNTRLCQCQYTCGSIL
ncbi:hypothetical protein LguiA_008226 [Lonicera macranthoides]